MILNLFASRPKHPLGDPKELKRVIGALPVDNPFKAADEVYGWFESLRNAEGFHESALFDVVRQLDEAGVQHVRRLARDYLHAARLSKSDERRLWSMNFNYWGELASLYAQCIEACSRSPKDKALEAMRQQLPLATARLVNTRACQQKWMFFRYGVVGEDLWRGLNQAYLQASNAGQALKTVHLYPAQTRQTSAMLQYLQALVLASSATDSLMPLEIELADRLVAHLLPDFVFSDQCVADSVYWIDAAAGAPPARLARPPSQIRPSMRFFAPGDAHRKLAELNHSVERGEVPKTLNLGGEYSAKIVLPVLRHLARYWAPVPPQRVHPRFPAKSRLAVLQGFDDCFTLFSGQIARLGKERSAESWVVENVSQSGFRARVDVLGEVLSIGALLGLQPEGGENWVLGVVRRFSKEPDGQATVGIEVLSKRAQSLELWPRSAGFSATGAMPGIFLRDGERGNKPADEMRFVLPAGSFDVRTNLESVSADERFLLSPIELEEANGNFEVARYRRS